MNKRMAKNALFVLMAVAIVCLAPFIPIKLALSHNLPQVEADAALSSAEVQEIVLQARGGKFVGLLEILSGQVNAPFTGVDVIGPQNIPYPDSVEDQSDVVVGYGSCATSGFRADCIGYRVFLKRTESGWKVVERIKYIT